jgi:BASS family bile acid:Na+ symporter
MPIEIAMGVMIIAAAPGGVTSNVLTKFANGDVALSVSLTAVVSLLAIFIVPLIVFNSANFIGVEITKEISMKSIAVKMFFVVTVPVLFGMIVRSLMTDFIISKTLIIQRLSIILFLIVFISIWVEEWDRIVSFIARAGLVTGILNLVMIFVGYYVAKMFASGVATKKMYFTRMRLTKRNISSSCGPRSYSMRWFLWYLQLRTH